MGPIRRWSQAVTGPTLATSLAAAATFVSTVIIFRELAEVDGGRFALFIALLEVFGMVGNHGVTTVINMSGSEGPPVR